jgi:two-component system chemotaxis response regulator CheB
VKRSIGRSADAAADDAASIGYQIVVVGTSWGGLAATRTVLETLPPEYDIPTAIVQHRHRDSDHMLARFLQLHTRLRVCDVEDKQPIESGGVFIAPANYHMLVEQGHFSLSTEAPVRFSRPSIDVAMASAADAYGHRAVGVVLTGANTDGAAGLRRISDRGGMVVIQDPATAEVTTMPSAAMRAVPTARVLPLDRIASFLGALPSHHMPTPKTA